MCLAVPMQVIEVRGSEDEVLTPRVAVVEADGVTREVRLDLADRWPAVGDFLIIHAGFAIHTLDREEAEKSLRLLQEMGDKTGQQVTVNHRPLP